MAEHALTAEVSPSMLQPRATLSSTQSAKRSRKQDAESVRLTVVIVNYRQWESTAALVRQILRSPEARRGAVEVVIVDNHSPWHPLAGRMRRWPGVSLRRWGHNRGFARAVNEGCRLGAGSRFLLLNPDMTLAEGFIDGVLSAADSLTENEPKAGIVGFGLRNNDGTIQHSCGAFPTLASTLTCLLLPRSRRKYCAGHARHRRPVSWVTGCSLLFRRECFKELGGLDESFFLYYEDVDLCRRARAKGWSVLHEPLLTAIHHNPTHARPITSTLRLVARHSILTYSSRHWPAWQFQLLTYIIRMEARLRHMLARRRGDETASGIMSELGLLAREMADGKSTSARRRVRRGTRDGDPRLL